MRRHSAFKKFCVFLAITTSCVAHAQTAAAPATPTESGDIVVTGSRIQSANAQSSSPVLAVSAAEIGLQGATNAEALLNQLPQVSGSNASSQSTFGTPGIATVNLRNLGPARTLVLIDGRRLMPGDPFQPFADINFVPTQLVSSVEVLTGGAAAAYGSDAVAGVVNFKMKHNLNGVIADYQFSAAQHENDNASAQAKLQAFGITPPSDKFDGFVHNATIALGKNFADGRGNVTVFAGYRHTSPVSNFDRDFSACGIGTVSGTNPYDTHVCTGSSNSAYGRFRTGGRGTGYSANPDGSATFVSYNGNLAYNSNEQSYLQQREDRYSGGAFANYEISNAAEVYGEFMFMDNHSRVQLAPSGIATNRTYTINCDNPLLSAAQATQLCGMNAGAATAVWTGTIGKRIVVPGRERYYDITHSDYRFVGGLKGNLGSGWTYDVSATIGFIDYRNIETNDVSVSATADGLLVRNVNGMPTCISGNASCVPLNIFQLGKFTDAMADYVFASGVQHGSIKQKVFQATLNGDLGVSSPWASNPIALALGAEYRRDSISMNATDNIVNGDLAGFGSSAPTRGQTNVKEVFTEALLPIIEDRPFADKLALNLAYRYSDYNYAGGAQAYKASLVYAPVSDLKFRGGYNRAVRAPSIVELFAPTLLSSASVTDPCSGAAPTASLAACMNSRVTAAQYGNITACGSNYCTITTGGNVALKPETADTYTLGFVFSPKALRQFSLSVDYYDIKVKNIIGTLSPTLILSQCLNSGSTFYCGLINRDSTGSLGTTAGYISNSNLNSGYLKTSGLDITANYRLNLSDVVKSDWGALSFGFNGTWTRERKVSPLPGQAAYDCAGLYGPTCGVPTPSWRHNFRVSWEMPWKAVLSINWRHVGPSTVDINEGNAVFTAATGGQKDIADARIGAYDYFDLSATATLTDNLELRAGMKNLFDRDPPVLDNYNLGVNAQYGNGNTFPTLYDVLGRTMFAGITARF